MRHSPSRVSILGPSFGPSFTIPFHYSLHHHGYDVMDREIELIELIERQDPH